MNAQDARSRKSLISYGVAALLAVGAATAQVAMAMTPTTGIIDNTGSYQHEVQACMSGKTQQDQATCLREARNAHADKKRGVLDTAGDLQANAVARCNVFTNADDKAACAARVSGAGSAHIEGDVASGGVLREAETVIPAGSQPTNAMGNR